MGCDKIPDECKNLEGMLGACNTGLKTADTIILYKKSLANCYCDTNEGFIACNSCKDRVAKALEKRKLQ